jgi:cephalosporin-C deacetylase-like acetyl esterase
MIVRMKRSWLVSAFFFLFAFGADGDDRFENERTIPLDVRVIDSSISHGVKVENVRYRSTRGGVIPATIVLPPSPTKASAIVFAHWGLGDRRSWLDEAMLLANHGVVSLLIDAPFRRTICSSEE